VNIMALNTSKRAIIDNRRREVAELRLRGKTQREIAQEVGCSLGSVNGDLKALRKAWQAAALETITEHQSRVLAEISEVKREAWGAESPELRTVLAALQQERALLGLDQLGALTSRQVEKLEAGLAALVGKHLPHEHQRAAFVVELGELVEAI